MESPALDLLHDLPLELLQHILLLLVPPSLPPSELQGLRWRYSTVCKRWAQILAHPHQVVLSSLPQIERLALLLAESSERTGEVREILVTPERFMGNVGHDAVAGLVDLCGGLERFGLWRPSKGSNATLLAEHSLLWDALIRRRGLVEFDCRATIHGVRLFQALNGWSNLKKLSLEWVIPRQSPLPALPVPLHHLRTLRLLLNPDISHVFSSYLDSANALEELSISNVSVVPFDASSFLRPLMGRLRRLSYHATSPLSESIDDVLQEATALHHLSLGPRPFGSASFLGNMTELRSLRLLSEEKEEEQTLDELEKGMVGMESPFPRIVFLRRPPQGASPVEEEKHGVFAAAEKRGIRLEVQSW